VSATTDLTLPAPGVQFALTRSYTSADQTNGELGRGWSYSSGPSLEVKSSGDVVLHAENGQQLLYAKGDDGNYYGQLLSRSTLAKSGSNYVLTTRAQVVYTFNAQGKPTTEVDRNGEGLSYGYGGDGRLATVTDAVGHLVAFTHNADGTLASVSVPDGRHVDYGYMGGQLTSVTDVRGNTTSYGYDAAGRLNDVQDQNGHTVVDNTYGADGRVSDQLNALGKHTGFSWDAATSTATLTDPRGKLWQDVYAPGGSELVERIDPLGNTTSFSYDANGNRATVSDARGNTTAYDYADDGDLKSITAPAPFSYTQSWTWNSRHDPTSYTNGRGYLWYEPMSGRFTAVDPLESPGGEPYRSPYQYAAGRPGVLVDPSGLSGRDIEGAGGEAGAALPGEYVAPADGQTVAEAVAQEAAAEAEANAQEAADAARRALGDVTGCTGEGCGRRGRDRRTFRCDASKCRGRHRTGGFGQSSLPRP
jgi:RHS repeat-associated protein